MLNLLRSKKSQPTITAILCAYERPHVLEEQIAAIKAQSFPVEECWLWYNKGEKPQVDVPGIKSAITTLNFLVGLPLPC